MADALSINFALWGMIGCAVPSASQIPYTKLGASMPTVPMTHMDTGKTADVHPDEVVNWRSHGWRESAPVPPPPPPPPAPPKQRETLTIPRKGV